MGKKVTLIHPVSRAHIEVEREHADKMLARGHGWTELENKPKLKSKKNAVNRSADKGAIAKAEEPTADNDCGCS